MKTEQPPVQNVSQTTIILKMVCKMYMTVSGVMTHTLWYLKSDTSVTYFPRIMIHYLLFFFCVLFEKVTLFYMFCSNSIAQMVNGFRIKKGFLQQKTRRWQTMEGYLKHCERPTWPSATRSWFTKNVPIWNKVLSSKRCYIWPPAIVSNPDNGVLVFNVTPVSWAV